MSRAVQCRNGVTRLTIVLLPSAGREVAQLVEEVPHYEMNLRDASKAFRKAHLRAIIKQSLTV